MDGFDIDHYEVIDDQGHKTGQLLDKQKVHAEQLRHEVVNVWIINAKGEVLLQLRAPEVELCPNVWDVAVGTHLRPGEDPLTAAVRCVHSELGLDILPTSIRHLFNIQAANPMADGRKHRVLGHVFLLKQDINPADITLDRHKIAKLAWKPVVEVMADIGGTDTSAQYFPREGKYYPQLFEALQAEVLQ